MIEIDGSIGEGGGSVVRLSSSLATIIQDSVRIYNIRKKRDNPGLRPQHLAGLKALKDLCDGQLEGGKPGSEEVTLFPKNICGKRINIKLETAASISLILQALMIPAPYSNEKIEIMFDGGATDTFFAPSTDYIKHVTLPVLRKMGYKGTLECLRRGHYPKGGGKARSIIEPVKKLRNLKLPKFKKIKKIHGISHCVKLPSRIAERQAKAAEEKLKEAGHRTKITIEYYKKSEDPHIGPGTGIVLWAKTKTKSILGASALGKKGKPAETVGREAANNLISQLETKHAVDKHLTDQLIPYLALADGESIITTTKLTSHTLTNIALVKKFLDLEVNISGSKGQPGTINVKGLGFSRNVRD